MYVAAASAPWELSCSLWTIEGVNKEDLLQLAMDKDEVADGSGKALVMWAAAVTMPAAATVPVVRGGVAVAWPSAIV